MTLFLSVLGLLLAPSANGAGAVERSMGDGKAIQAIFQVGKKGSGGCSTGGYRTTHGHLVSRGPAGSSLIKVRLPITWSFEQQILAPDRSAVRAIFKVDKSRGVQPVIVHYRTVEGKVVKLKTMFEVIVEAPRPAPCADRGQEPMMFGEGLRRAPHALASDGDIRFSSQADKYGDIDADGQTNFYSNLQGTWGNDMRWIGDGAWPHSLQFSVGGFPHAPGSPVCEGFGAIGKRTKFNTQGGWYSNVTFPLGEQGLVAGEASCVVSYPTDAKGSEFLEARLRFKVTPQGDLHLWTGERWMEFERFIGPRVEISLMNTMRDAAVNDKFLFGR